MIITLTTDFGTRDGYVGAMKGVIARLAPTATMLDLAHDIPRGDIAHAAWVIATAERSFAVGAAIHVVVVDPGVGGPRRGVIVTTQRGWFVGPDNGVFAYVRPATGRGHEIRNSRFHAPHVSPTFHGRDVFAVAAARLANSDLPEYAGPSVALVGSLPWGERPEGEGRVVHIDVYGNLITDLPAREAGQAIAIAGTILPIVTTYDDARSGELLAYVGSSSTIEIAVRDGRADERLRAARGLRVMPSVAGGDGPYR